MQIRQISKCFWSFSQEESLFVNSKAPSAMYSECFVLIPSKTCSDRPCGGILMLGTSRTRHRNKLYKALERVVQGSRTSDEGFVRKQFSPAGLSNGQRGCRFAILPPGDGRCRHSEH